MRLIRDVENEKILFVWEICIEPASLRLKGQDELKKQLQAYMFLVKNAHTAFSITWDLRALSESEMKGLINNTPQENQINDIGDQLASSFEHTPENMNTDYTRFQLTSHSYYSLDRFSDEIRIICIEPHRGDENSPLICDLIHIPLAAKQEYCALSYAWGKGPKPSRYL